MFISEDKKKKYLKKVHIEMKRRGLTSIEIPMVINKTGFMKALEDYPELDLDDDSTKVFLNTSVDLDGLSDDLINFMNYISKCDVKGEFIKKLTMKFRKQEIMKNGGLSI